MIAGASLLINVSAYAVALGITILSWFYLLRQRVTAYHLTREFLILVYGVILFLIVFDLFRLLSASSSLMQAYPLFSFGVGFIEAILLLTAAVGAYLRPSGSSYRLFFKDIRDHPAHLLVFLLFILGTLAAEAYLALFKPFTVVVAQDFAGGSVMAVKYSSTFSLTIGALFAFFLAYPVALLVVGGLRMHNAQMKRAQLGLAIGFAGSSAIYLISSLSLFNYGLDVTAIAYIILAVLFGLAARNFRRATVFAGFVAVTPAPASAAPPPPYRAAYATSGTPVTLQEGQLTLVEVDTSSRYEDTLNALVVDFLQEERGVFVISAKGSRIHSFFAQVQGVKLYSMSESTKYIAPSTTNPGEVSIPLFDASILLEVLDRTLASAEPIAILFDSVSDMMIYSSFQPTYKFLKEAGAMISGKRAVALFTLFEGAHDEKNVMAIKSCFASQLKVGREGIDVVR